MKFIWFTSIFFFLCEFKNGIYLNVQRCKYIYIYIYIIRYTFILMVHKIKMTLKYDSIGLILRDILSGVIHVLKV